MPEINYYNVKENTGFICFPLPSCIICTRAFFWLLWGTVFAESKEWFWKSDFHIPSEHWGGGVGWAFLKSICQAGTALEALSKALIALSVRARRNVELHRLMLDRIIRKLSLEVTTLVFPKETCPCQMCAVQI